MLWRVQIAPGMKAWVIPPSESPRPTKEISKGERKLEWVVQEGDDGYQL